VSQDIPIGVAGFALVKGKFHSRKQKTPSCFKPVKIPSKAYSEGFFHLPFHIFHKSDLSVFGFSRDSGNPAREFSPHFRVIGILFAGQFFPGRPFVGGKDFREAESLGRLGAACFPAAKMADNEAVAVNFFLGYR
jgi:hypothetical protein